MLELGQKGPYVKFVLRTFHSALIYIENNCVVGLCVWKIVNRDISVDTVIDPYVRVLVLNTTDDALDLDLDVDVDLVSAMLGDIERFCYTKNIGSIVLAPRTSDEERLYQHLGFLIVSVFPSVSMHKKIVVHI